jgi:hypothetical protein
LLLLLRQTQHVKLKWPNNISRSILWRQLWRKGANDKTIMAAIHISIATMAEAVRQG